MTITIDQVVANSNSGSGDSGFEDLKENAFKVGPDQEVVVKFNKENIYQSYEMWVTPSNNLPEGKDASDSQYAFRLKNAEGHNTLAEILGSPSLWGVTNKGKVRFGQFKGGIYEFEYTDRKNSDNFPIKDYKYVHDPEYREFFKKFSFKGKSYDRDENPKVNPSLRNYVEIYIADDSYCRDKKSWRHFMMSQKQLSALASFHSEGFTLDDTWFKLKREGSGLQTKYQIIPMPGQTSQQFNETYDTSSLAHPDLELATSLSSDAYCWKYLQDYIIEADKILGTNYSEPMRKAYQEKQEAASEATSGSTSESSSLPPEVAQAMDAPSLEKGNSEAAVPAGVSEEDDPFNDDDIPF